MFCVHPELEMRVAITMLSRRGACILPKRVSISTHPGHSSSLEHVYCVGVLNLGVTPRTRSIDATVGLM